MSYLTKIFASLLLLFFSHGSYAQTSQTDSLANLLAQKMKDSLSLTSEQKNQIYTINTTILTRDSNLRKMFIGSKSLISYLELLGEQRDSLYKSALPNDKYLLYLSKKRNIVLY